MYKKFDLDEHNWWDDKKRLENFYEEKYDEITYLPFECPDKVKIEDALPIPLNMIPSDINPANFV